jgi:hypothetical protein
MQFQPTKINAQARFLTLCSASGYRMKRAIRFRPPHKASERGKAFPEKPRYFLPKVPELLAASPGSFLQRPPLSARNSQRLETFFGRTLAYFKRTLYLCTRN